jgi:hypothetical protein
VPYWSDDLEKITAVGTHLFFRWPGGWGQSGAFRGTLSGIEPAIGKLANLSSAHGEAKVLEGQVLADPEQIVGSDTVIVPDCILRPTTEGRVSGYFRPAKSVQAAGDTLYIALDGKSDPAEFVALAQTSCGARTYCKVFGWTNAGAVPQGGSMNDAARSSMAFSYLKNSTQNYEKALWNCSDFPRADKKQCMKR